MTAATVPTEPPQVQRTKQCITYSIRLHGARCPRGHEGLTLIGTRAFCVTCCQTQTHDQSWYPLIPGEMPDILAGLTEDAQRLRKWLAEQWCPCDEARPTEGCPCGLLLCADCADAHRLACDVAQKVMRGTGA